MCRRQRAAPRESPQRHCRRGGRRRVSSAVRPASSAACGQSLTSPLPLSRAFEQESCGVLGKRRARRVRNTGSRASLCGRCRCEKSSRSVCSSSGLSSRTISSTARCSGMLRDGHAGHMPARGQCQLGRALRTHAPHRGCKHEPNRVNAGRHRGRYALGRRSYRRFLSNLSRAACIPKATKDADTHERRARSVRAVDSIARTSWSGSSAFIKALPTSATS